MEKRNIILSFDYELFFGIYSGTVQKTLIEPTNILLDSMEKNGMKGNFFVDVFMFWAFEELSDSKIKSDLNLLKNQIYDIIRRGHRIELHLHPHWIDAKYKGEGKWDFSVYQHYSLTSFSEDEVTDYIVKGTDYLNQLAREVDSNYQICAFRAGGWAVQPFEHLKRGFIYSNIQIDSSVASGAYGLNQYSFFDFTKAPKNSCWRFHDDVCKPDDNGIFYEVPITSFHRGLLYRTIDWLSRRIVNTLSPVTDGTHKRIDLVEAPHPKSSKNIAMMTMSKLSPISVLLSFLLCKSKIVTFIDHPKDLSLSVITTMSLISKYSRSIFYSDLLCLPLAEK